MKPSQHLLAAPTGLAAVWLAVEVARSFPENIRLFDRFQVTEPGLGVLAAAALFSPLVGLSSSAAILRIEPTGSNRLVSAILSLSTTVLLAVGALFFRSWRFLGCVRSDTDHFVSPYKHELSALLFFFRHSGPAWCLAAALLLAAVGDQISIWLSRRKAG